MQSVTSLIFNEPLVYTIMCITNLQTVNPSHVVTMETSRTLDPEDLDVSGSAGKSTNNARARDYIHTQGKAIHGHCQNLRSRVTLDRESFSVLLLVLISCKCLFELGLIPMAIILTSRMGKLKPDRLFTIVYQNALNTNLDGYVLFCKLFSNKQ